MGGRAGEPDASILRGSPWRSASQTPPIGLDRVEADRRERLELRLERGKFARAVELEGNPVVRHVAVSWVGGIRGERRFARRRRRRSPAGNRRRPFRRSCARRPGPTRIETDSSPTLPHRRLSDPIGSTSVNSTGSTVALGKLRADMDLLGPDAEDHVAGGRRRRSELVAGELDAHAIGTDEGGRAIRSRACRRRSSLPASRRSRQRSG